MSESIFIGKELEKERIADIEVNLPLKTLNLHGMIGGSTGTGKSRAIQVIVEELSAQGIPVLLGDLKGDISGFAFPNNSEKALERAKRMKINYAPKEFETNYWSVSQRFIPFRLRLSDIDPVLISRVLKLNSTQESNLRIAYLYAKAKDIALTDLIDLKNLLDFIARTPGAIEGAHASSINIILRQVKIVIGEGMNEFFGEPAIQLEDLMQGINVINLSDWRKRGDILAILMAFVIYRLFNELPDVGDVDKPKLVVFIDEAHYLFQDANPNLVNLIITILKQIRSKGVGVFFSSQNPEDIPEKILEQLGCKIEFALRAFTKNELDDIRGIARAFPPSEQYDLEKEIPMLGNGIAFVSALDETGRPFDPVKTMVAPPKSFMDVAGDERIKSKINQMLFSKYYEKTGLQRAEFSGGPAMRKLPLERRTYWDESMRQAVAHDKKVTRQVNQSWNRLKWVAIFLLFILLIVIIIVLLLK